MVYSRQQELRQVHGQSERGQLLEREILALKQRLGRCCQAISELEQQIVQQEQQG